MTPVLSIQNLTKRYGAITAINGLTIDVKAGSIYGILGPNGSGKTTTLSIVLGVINQSNGNFSWYGEPPTKEARKKIGALLEQPNFYPYLSAIQNLEIVCEIKGLDYSNIEPVLKQVNLYERRKSKFKTYSLGMKQRLALASVLLGNPDVMVLDEPTNGLDPQGIVEIRKLIIDLGKSGKTILLASHLLDEVEKVCTHVAVIKRGNLLAEGAVAEILTGDEQIEVSADDLTRLGQALESSPLINKVTREENLVVASLNEGTDGATINKHLMDNGIIASHLAIRKKSLEAQFLELTAE